MTAAAQREAPPGAELKVAVLGGDGVGPEVTAAAMQVLEAAVRNESVTLSLTARPVGWKAVLEGGSPLPEATLQACLAADAVFLGAVGHPDAIGQPRDRLPETGLLGLRKALACWANLRPVRVPPSLVGVSASTPERVRGTDVMILRELGGGLYYGEPRGEKDGKAWNTMVYSEDEVQRIARLGLSLARGRHGRLTSVDKANVLEVSRLWRRVVDETAAEKGHGVEVDHMLVDRAAMELMLNPTQFDVLLTENLFGDILSDQAGALVGSLGALGSASLGDGTDLYEPVHGSAPDIAGKGVANPLGAMASVALMLPHTFRMEASAQRVESAYEAVLADGIRTVDVKEPGQEPVGTTAFTDAVLERIESTTESAAITEGVR
ncbi:MAG TPA: 3-isopropylmalate dehydrogenase [Gemmatimonadetes bacterium]|nr:3-isopropylmalate dehydrogenase [Gemmatimonadota bacterium]